MSPTGDLELGNTDMIQESVLHLLYRAIEHRKTYLNQPQFSPSICMVPPKLRDLNPNSFTPRHVSIGPLHREDEKLKKFEWVKAKRLMDLMDRIGFPQEEILKSCMEKVYASMKEIKACYVWPKTYSDAEIAEMMVMDACFILEILYVVKRDNLRGVNPFVICDLLLLENQIPFFILDKIFQCTVLQFDPSADLVELIILYLLRLLPLFRGHQIEIHNAYIDPPHHILSLLHQCYHLGAPSYYVDPASIPLTIPSVGDLDSAGVKFKTNQDQYLWPMEMKMETHWCSGIFGSWCKPTLRMPQLIVSDKTRMVLSNLVAFEESTQSRSYFTSYVVAMARLVKTQEDVEKLVDSKVLDIEFTSNEDVAHIINNICKEVAPRNFFFYNEEFKILNKYWKNNIAWFRRTYFKSPWNMTALLGGIILFLLTAVQTFYAIRPAK